MNFFNNKINKIIKINNKIDKINKIKINNNNSFYT